MVEPGVSVGENNLEEVAILFNLLYISSKVTKVEPGMLLLSIVPAKITPPITRTRAMSQIENDLRLR